MVDKFCEVCNKLFSVRPYREKTARFCSQVCGGKWHMSVRKMSGDHKIGNKYRKGMRPTNAFTSERVKSMNTVESLKFSCSECFRDFELKPWLARQNKSKSGMRFCSKDCYASYASKNLSGKNSPLWVGGPTTYRGRGWLDARLKAVERDNGTCQRCGLSVGKSIPVHHKKPFRLFECHEEANSLDNLICLCQSCHMKVEPR